MKTNLERLPIGPQSLPRSVAAAVHTDQPAVLLALQEPVDGVGEEQREEARPHQEPHCVRVQTIPMF